MVGVGEPNVDALRKSLAAQRAVGVQTEEIDTAEVARLWPFADLSPFAAFGWEARGGYGDAYQTAQAFAVSARAAGVRVRQGTAMTDLLLDGDRVTGVRLADGTEVAAGTVVVATGVWTRDLLARYGIDVPIRVVREQIVMISPGVELGPVPVFSDLVSLQYIRPEPGGDILFGNSDLSHVRGGRSRRLPQPGDRGLRRRHDRQASGPGFPASPTPRSPAATPAATTSPRTGTR